MELLKEIACSFRGRVRNHSFDVNQQSFIRPDFSKVDLQRRRSYSEIAMRSLNLHHGHHHHHHAQSVLAAMSGVAK
jgi:hypothetical protein